jgi:hypothetical protein
MIIKVSNILANSSPKTFLSNTTSSGTSSLPVKNTNGFTPSWAVQVGDTGQEQSEVRVLGAGALSGTSFSLLSATSFDHPEDTPVFAIKYDQIIFERSTTGTAGTATPMTGGTVTIQPDNQYTMFDDSSGASTYAYKTAYYNSVLGGTSSESDWITSGGYSFYSLAMLRERAKSRLYSAKYVNDPDDWNMWANEWLEQMSNAMADVNEDYRLGSTAVAYSGTTELGTVTATDFKYPRRVWYTADGVNTYRATKMDLNTFMPDQTFNNTNPYYYMIGENVIGRQPHDTAGTLQIYYYKETSVLVNDTDEIPQIMRDYSKSFIDYMVAQAMNKDGKDGSSKEALAQAQLNQFKIQISPHDRMGNETVEIVEDTGDMSEAW